MTSSNKCNFSASSGCTLDSMSTTLIKHFTINVWIQPDAWLHSGQGAEDSWL